MSDIDQELEAAVAESEAATRGDAASASPPDGDRPPTAGGAQAPGVATGADASFSNAGRIGGGHGPEGSGPPGVVAGGLVSDRPASSPPPPQRNVGLLIALLVIGGAILAMVLSSVDEAAVYSVTTDKLLADKGSYMGRTLRVEGELVKGSLRHRAEPCEYRFSIKKGESVLPVRYAACIVPDTFRDVPDMDVQVTAEGELLGEGYFEASHIMAKCPSKYEMQSRKAKGEVMPHGELGAPPAAAPIVD